MRAVIDRLNESLEGRYAVERELGEGGMATVYLAQDLRHDRKVAIKVLKSELAVVVGAERFLAEIRTTANLQHPHILPLFDSGEADGFLYYVMPYVHGESLRERLDRERQLSVGEALDITRKVAEALDYAHDEGVIHRDIKPANILLSERGEPLVADFGIALAVSQAGGGRITETGLSLGTPHYMSPEQATGERDVDLRTDVWALGCVLYEMLAGDPPFAAPAAQAVLARILTEEPRDIRNVRKSAPEHVAAVLGRALEKLPADRFVDVAAFRRALEDPGYRYRRTEGVGARSRPGLEEVWGPVVRWSVVVAAAIGGAALGVLGVGLMGEPEPVPGTRGAVVRVPLDPVELRGATARRGFDISPDGSLIVFSPGPEAALELLALRGPTRRTLPGTDTGFGPVFSPDGRRVVYSTPAGDVLQVGLDGGAPTVVSDGDFFLVSDWTDDGALYAWNALGGFRLREGEEPEPILDQEDVAAQQVRVVPGASAILFIERAYGETIGRVRVLDLESGEVRTLVEDAFDARYAPTGHVVYARPDGTLLAAPFDAGRLELDGPPRVVLDSVAVERGAGEVVFDLAANGAAVYTRGPGYDPALTEGTIVFIDPGGDRAPESPPVRPGRLQAPAVSPDGRVLAYNRFLRIHVFDLVTGRDEPVVPEGEVGLYPVWSPSGDTLAYTSDVGTSTGFEAVIQPLDPAGEAERIGLAYPSVTVTSWAPGEDRILLTVGEGETIVQGEQDLVIKNLVTGEVTPYLESGYSETWGRISPDGRWVTYLSDERGRNEAFVRAFPEPGLSVRVSGGSGPAVVNPRWSPDGRTLYYLRGDSVYAVSVDGSGDSFSAEAPRALLSLNREDGRLGEMGVHPDGRLIFVLSPPARTSNEGDPSSRRSYLVVNWLHEMLTRVEAP